MQRDFVAVSERGMAIRRQPGKPEVQSNKEIERAITLFDRGLINIKEFLVTVSVRKEELLECHDSDEAELLIEISQIAHVIIKLCLNFTR